MEKRHYDQLMGRLDELWANGTTFISFGELYHWYQIDRIAKRPWRDIHARWAEILSEKGMKYSDPYVAQVPGGVSFFFHRTPQKLSDLAA